MAKGTPTPTQQRVLKARRAHPELTASEIAKQLNMSSGAVYQAEGRLRQGGHLPKLRGRKSRRGPRPSLRGVSQRTAVAKEATPQEAASNGSPNGAVEQLDAERVIAAELDSTRSRIEQIVGEQKQLSEELHLREERAGKLSAAQNALVGVGTTPSE